MNIKYLIKFLKIIIDSIIYWLRGIRPYRRSDFGACGTGVYVSPGCQFHTPLQVVMGSDIYFGPSCTVFGHGGVVIGDDVVFGENVMVMSSNHEFDGPRVDSVPFGTGHVSHPVTIGRGAWLGSHVIVRPGASIGKFCIVGAGAVIGGHAEDFGIYAGNPAKLIRKRKNVDIESIPVKWVSSKRGSIRIIE